MPISVGTTHQTFMVMSMALFICLLLNKIVTTKDITPKTLFFIYKSTDLQTKQLKSTSSWLGCNNRYTLKIMTFQTIPAQPINLQVWWWVTRRTYPHKLLDEKSYIFPSNRNWLNATPNDITICNRYNMCSPISNIHYNPCHLTLRRTVGQSKWKLSKIYQR